MARLIRNKPVDHSTGKTLQSILEEKVAKGNRGTLTGYVCGAINGLLAKGMAKKKGVKVTEYKTFDVLDHAEALSVVKSKEFSAAMGYGDEVSKKLKRFGVKLENHVFALAAAMDVKVEFKNKATSATAAKHKVKGFVTYMHEKGVKIYDTRFVRIPTKDGSIILYMPKSAKEITHDFRKALLKKKFVGSTSQVCVPHVKFSDEIALQRYISVKAYDTVDGADLRLDSYLLHTDFEMDAVGARIQQKAVMRLTKGIAKEPKIIKFNKPFIVIVERNGQEVFSAAINKKDWVKG